MNFASTEREGRNSRTRIFTLLTVTALLLASAAAGLFVMIDDSDDSDAAAIVTVDGFKYRLQSTEAFVIGYVGFPTTFDIPSAITYGENTYNVTRISALTGCMTVTSVSIPSSVTSIGASAFYGCFYITEFTVDEGNDYYTSVDGVLFDESKEKLLQYPVGKTNTTYAIPDTVTSIGENAFSGCESLTSVTIPSSVQNIGYSAFSECKSLTSMEIPASVTSIGDAVFERCKSLTAISVAGGSSFSALDGVLYDYGKTKLIQYPAGKTDATYTVPKTVEDIGTDAFYGCASIKAIEVESGSGSFSSKDGVLFNEAGTALICYPAGKTDQSYTVSGILDISGDAFRGNTFLKSVEINGINTIVSGAFDGCTALETVTINASIGEISDGLFYGCTSLKSVTIPDSVTSIGEVAFSSCISLKTVSIPAEVGSISSDSFEGCTSLTAIEVAEGNATYESVDGVLYNKVEKELMQYPAGKTDTAFTIPQQIASVAESAFFECASLTAIEVAEGNTAFASENGVLFTIDMAKLMQYPAGKTDASYKIPAPVTEIATGAFYYAHNLKSITVADGNTQFSSSSGCLLDKDGKTLIICPAGLESVTVGKDVTRIAGPAFSGKNLKEVTFEGAPFVASVAFYKCTALNKLTIKSADIKFDTNSLAFPDGAKHTVYVVAPEGYRIGSYALTGDVEIVYGEPPSPTPPEPTPTPDPDSDDKKKFPVVPVVAGSVVGVLALAGAAFFIIRRRA